MLDEKLIQEADAAAATGLANGNKEAKKAQADTAKMKLALDQAKEKEDLAKQQERERENLKNVAEAKDSPVVNKNSKYNIAKSIMSLSDFRKSTGQMTKDETEISDKVHDGLVGNAHLHTDHGVRHRKVKYHLGEASAAAKLQKAFQREQEKIAAERKAGEELLKKPAPVKEDVEVLDEKSEQARKNKTMKNVMDASKGAAFNRTSGLNLKPGDTGHQTAQQMNKALGRNLRREETDEQQTQRTVQLKRFKDQAKDSKLTEAQYAGLEKESKPGKIKTAIVKTHPKAVESETVEGWEDEKKPVKEEFDDINEAEFVLQVEADMDALTEEDFYEAYDDEELAIIDDETGEEIEAVDSVTEEALMEVLSRIERIRAKARMRRSQTKRQRREKVALRTLSSPQVANKRARRMAISAMKKRLLKGQNPQKISVGERERVERFIAQRKKIVDRLSARMVSRVKQVEKARMSHKKFTKPNNGVAF